MATRSRRKSPMKIICFGDSITMGSALAEGDRWPTVLHGLLDEWRPGAYAVYNRGVDGHTTTEGLDRFERDVLPLLPATVLVEFGFNDSHVRSWTKRPRVGLDEFQANIREIHRIIRARKGRCVLIANHPIGQLKGRGGNGRPHNANIALFDRAVRQTAQALRAPLIDLPALTKQHGLTATDLVCPDQLHLSAEGSHRYAAMVFETLQGVLIRR